jgi:protocatechuate 3,4-dioxygenase beta subunit
MKPRASARQLLILSAVLLLLSPLFLSAQRSSGKKSDDAAAPRNLTGSILDKAGYPVPGAVVYLKNSRNLAVSTFITGDDGGYRFNNLSPDIDYQVRAEANGSKSPARTLSSFDTHKQPHINLKFGK